MAVRAGLNLEENKDLSLQIGSFDGVHQFDESLLAGSCQLLYPRMSSF